MGISPDRGDRIQPDQTREIYWPPKSAKGAKKGLTTENAEIAKPANPFPQKETKNFNRG
jgi:hypothetical protein